MPHRLDHLLGRRDLTHHELERFLCLETERLDTLASLAATELRIGSAGQAATALAEAGWATADLRAWLGRAAGHGIELEAVALHVAHIERQLASLLTQLGMYETAEPPDRTEQRMEDENDWQRTTDHPSARALLSFLEADLSRGLRLLRQLRAEEDAKDRAELLAEIRQVQTEVERWVRHAGSRSISLTGLGTHLGAFRAALEEVFGGGGPRA